MISKTWAIGEYCKNGVISVEVHSTYVKIINREWDNSKGTTRDSDQSNAKVVEQRIYPLNLPNIFQRITQFLEDLTTPYYADKIVKWLQTGNDD